jgi:hypothetical protein
MIPANIKPETMLNMLAAVHVVASLVLGIFVYASLPGEEIARILFFGLFLAQIGLVGFRATHGLSSLGSRVNWFLVTMLYWIVLFSMASPGGGLSVIFMISGYAAIVIFPLRAVRKWVARLDRPLQLARAGTQFRIRHLFLLTFAISLLLAVGKWIPPGSLQGGNLLLIIPMLVFAFGTVEVAAVWAMLSKSSAWLPALFVLSYAAAAGWFMDSRLYPGSNSYNSTCIFLADAVLLLASLAFVRWCGYRLVPLREGAEPLPSENVAAEASATPGDMTRQADPFSA